MPLYYFDLRDEDRCSPDDFGDRFDDFEAARQQAQAILADLMRDEMPGENRRTVGCDVRDEAGQVVYSGRMIYLGRRLDGRHLPEAWEASGLADVT